MDRDSFSWAGFAEYYGNGAQWDQPAPAPQAHPGTVPSAGEPVGAVRLSERPQWSKGCEIVRQGELDSESKMA